MRIVKRAACAVTALSLLTSCVSSPSEVGGYDRLPDLMPASDAGCVVSGRQPVWVYMGTRPQVRKKAIQAFSYKESNIQDIIPFRDLADINESLKEAERELKVIEGEIKRLNTQIKENKDPEKEKTLKGYLGNWEDYQRDIERYRDELNFIIKNRRGFDGDAGFLSAKNLRGQRIGTSSLRTGADPSNSLIANSIDIASRAYFGVQIRYMNLDTNYGVTGKTYYPAIKSRLDFATLEEQSKKRLDFITTAPQVLTDNAAKPNRVLIKNRQLLSPTPYLGGGVIAEFSLIAIGSGDIARSALSIVDNVSEVTGFSFVSQIGAFGRVVKDGIDKILNVDEGSRFRAGVATSFEDPIIGYWVLMWPQQDWERQILDYVRVLFAGKNVSSKIQKRLSDYLYHNGVDVCDMVVAGSRFKLNEEFIDSPKNKKPDPDKERILDPNVEPQLYLKLSSEHGVMKVLAEELKTDPDTENLDVSNEHFWNLGGISWALIEFEAFENHPAIFRVPGLSSVYREVTEAFSTGDLSDAWRRLGEFQVFVRRSADLTELDKARLVSASNTRFHEYCKFLAENFQPLRKQIKDKKEGEAKAVCDEYSPRPYDVLVKEDAEAAAKRKAKKEAGERARREAEEKKKKEGETDTGDESGDEANPATPVAQSFLFGEGRQKIVSRHADYLSDRTPVQIVRYEGSESVRPWTAKSFTSHSAAEFAKVLEDGAFEDLIREYNLTTAIPLNWSPAKERNFDELGYEFRRLETLEQASSQ